LELLAAFQFLTILPIKRGFTAEQLGRSTAFFPVVGVAIGLVLAGLDWVLNLILPSSLVNIMMIAVLATLSGALHLDGLADTLDGIAGHRTAERRLEIMRDSRIGGFGAVGLALFLLMEYVALNSIPQNWVPFTLIVAPTLSRWAMVVSIISWPYARVSGLGSSFKQFVTPLQLIIATIIAIIVTAGVFRLAGLVLIVAVWIVLTLTALYLKSKLTGLTGDTYGAINEITTLSVFIVVTMLAHNRWLIG
jgi:adenosylcobinamide-GDP ribazoletransferase